MSCRFLSLILRGFYQSNRRSKSAGAPRRALKALCSCVRSCGPAQGRPWAPPAPGLRAQQLVRRGEGSAAAQRRDED
jgi:hypothetical protein